MRYIFKNGRDDVFRIVGANVPQKIYQIKLSRSDRFGYPTSGLFNENSVFSFTGVIEGNSSVPDTDFNFFVLARARIDPTAILGWDRDFFYITLSFKTSNNFGGYLAPILEDDFRNYITRFSDGGIIIDNVARSGTVRSFAELSDTDINDTNPISDQHIMVYDSTSQTWINQPISSLPTTASLGALTNVNPTADTATDGQIIKFNSGANEYQNVDNNLNDLADINSAGISNGQVLKWDTATSKYIPLTIPQAEVLQLTQLSDVTITAPTNLDYLKFNSTSGEWENSQIDNTQLASVGAGESLISGFNTPNEWQLKSLESTDNSVTLIQNPNTVDLSTSLENLTDTSITNLVQDQLLKYDVVNGWQNVTLPLGGEANTASNQGTGTGIFIAKNGVDLEFKSLTSTTGQILLQDNGTSINLTPSLSVNNIIGLNSVGASSGQVLTYDGISNYTNQDLPNPTTNVDLKANAGIVLDTNELALDLSATAIQGTLGVQNGGTGRTTLLQNSILSGNSTGGIVQIPKGTDGHILTSASPPTFGQLNLGTTNALIGQLPKSLGGTGVSDYTIATETFSGKTINANTNTLILGTNDLSDVLSVGIADNQYLRYNQANLRFEAENLDVNLTSEVNGILPLANGGTNSADYRSSAETLTNKTIDSANNTLTIPVGDLSDVVDNTPLDNQVLQYNVNQYQNQYYQMPSDTEANILANTNLRSQGVMAARNDAQELRIYQNGEYRYIPTFTKDNPWLNITEDFAPVVRFMPQNLSGTAGSFVWVDSVSGVDQVNSQVTSGAGIGTYGSNPKNALELTTNDWIALNTVSPIVGNTDCTFYCVYQDFLNSGAGFGRLLSCLNDISQSDNLGNQNIAFLANGTGEVTSIFSRVTNIAFDTPYLSETNSAGQRVVLMFRYVQSTGQLLVKFNDVTYLTDISSTGVDWLWNVFGFGKSIGVRTDGLTSIKVHESAIFDSALSESSMTEIYNRISFEYDTGYPAVSNQYVLNSLEDVSVSSPDAGTTLYYNPATSNWNNFPMTMGSMYWEGNATFTTINTQNVWEKISGTSILKANMQFSMPLDNRLLYNGSTVIHTHIVAQYSAVANNTDRICEFSIFKNGVREVPLLSSNLNGTRVNGNALHSDFMMSNGDYVELYTRNTENTDNVLVTNFYLFILGIPVQS